MSPSFAPRPALSPLVKWTGGKRSEIPLISPAYPAGIRRVVEPFAGGAAVSLALNPDRIVLGDMAQGLIAFYQALGSPQGRARMTQALATIDKLRAAARAAVAALSDDEVVASFAPDVRSRTAVAPSSSSPGPTAEFASTPDEMDEAGQPSLDPKAAARRKAAAVAVVPPVWLEHESCAPKGRLMPPGMGLLESIEGDGSQIPEGLVQKCEDLWPMPLGRAGSRVGQDLVASWRDKCHLRIAGLVAKGARFTVDQLRDHLETALQAGIYTTLRRIYNGEVPVSSGIQPVPPNELPAGWAEASWFAVRCLCYSAMFRYGPTGLFNVPYGGISYNSRTFAPSIAQFEHPATVDFFGRCTPVLGDFGDLFAQHHHFADGFAQGDFVFVDPPYDSAFSQYNADADFGRADQERLRDELLKLDCPWMMVIKNTPFILDLYQGRMDAHGRPLVCAVFSKNYQVNFRNRHDRGVEHLVVVNYPIPDGAKRENGGAFELLPDQAPAS